MAESTISQNSSGQLPTPGVDADLTTGLPGLLSKAGFWVYFAMAFLVPLLFVPPFFKYFTIDAEVVLIKDLAVTIFGSVILVLTAMIYLITGNLSLARNPVVSGAVVFYAVSMILSVLFSLSPQVSFGHYLRYLPLLVFILATPYFIQTRAQVRWLLLGVIGSAFVTGFLCTSSYLTGGDTLIPIYGVNIYELQTSAEGAGLNIQGGTDRALYFATFGNPEFTGTFLSAGIVLFGAWIWNLIAGNREKSSLPIVALWTCLAVLTLFGMLLTNTRSSLAVVALCVLLWGLLELKIRPLFLGVFAILFTLVMFFSGLLGGAVFGMLAFVILAAYLAWSGKLQAWFRAMTLYQKILISGVFAGAMLVIVAVAVVPQLRVRAAPLAERIESGMSVTDQSVRERLMFYLLASEMVRESPVFGKGPGMYPAHFHSTLAEVVERDNSGVLAYNQILLESWIAKQTHNDFFQIVSENGIAGLLIFLFLMVAVLQPLIAVMRFSDWELAGLAQVVILGICAYLIMMMASFPLQESGRAGVFHILVCAGYAIGLIFRAEKMNGAQVKS